MPKFPKPFFRSGRGWYVQLGKEQIKLADGPKNSDTESAALKRYHELMAERGRDKPANSANPDALSAVEVFDKFLSWSQKHNAPRTYEWYRDHIQGFINHAGNVVEQPYTQIKPLHVIEWVDSHGDAWSPAYRRGAIIAIQRPFNWAEELGYIPMTPIKRIKKPEAQRREQYVSPDEWPAIRDHYPDGDPFRDLLEVAWETGCRPQEVKWLEPRHVQLDKRLIFIPKEEAKGKKHPRVIYLSDRAEQIIAKHMQQYPEGVIFRNEDGEPWTRHAMSCRFERLKKHLGVKYCGYDLRHGFGTRKLVDGHSPAVVAEAKPGGILAMVTSHFTLDRQNGEAREHFGSKADFLGAIRLPSDAFKREGTSVVTDIVFFRKRAPGESARHEEAEWHRSRPFDIDGTEVSINRYFVRHPEMVLGNWTTKDTLYGEGFSVTSNGDLAQQLKEAVARLPQFKMASRPNQNAFSTENPQETAFNSSKNEIKPPPSLSEGSFFIDDSGTICQILEGQAEPVTYGGTKLAAHGTMTGKRMAALIGLRDRARAVLKTQNEGASEAARAEARKELNWAYARRISLTVRVGEAGPISS